MENNLMPKKGRGRPSGAKNFPKFVNVKLSELLKVFAEEAEIPVHISVIDALEVNKVQSVKLQNVELVPQKPVEMISLTRIV